MHGEAAFRDGKCCPAHVDVLMELGGTQLAGVATLQNAESAWSETAPRGAPAWRILHAMAVVWRLQAGLEAPAWAGRWTPPLHSPAAHRGSTISAISPTISYMLALCGHYAGTSNTHAPQDKTFNYSEASFSHSLSWTFNSSFNQCAWRRCCDARR